MLVKWNTLVGRNEYGEIVELYCSVGELEATHGSSSYKTIRNSILRGVPAYGLYWSTDTEDIEYMPTGKIERIDIINIDEFTSTMDITHVIDERIDKETLHALVSSLLDEMPERTGKSLYMRYYLEMTYKEIGSEWGISSTQASNICKEGLSLLRDNPKVKEIAKLYF